MSLTCAEQEFLEPRQLSYWPSPVFLEPLRREPATSLYGQHTRQLLTPALRASNASMCLGPESNFLSKYTSMRCTSENHYERPKMISLRYAITLRISLHFFCCKCNDIIKPSPEIKMATTHMHKNILERLSASSRVTFCAKCRANSTRSS